MLCFFNADQYFELEGYPGLIKTSLLVAKGRVSASF